MRTITKAARDAMFDNDLSESFEIFVAQSYYIDAVSFSDINSVFSVVVVIYDLRGLHMHNASHVFAESEQDRLDAAPCECFVFDTHLEAFDYCTKFARDYVTTLENAV